MSSHARSESARHAHADSHDSLRAEQVACRSKKQLRWRRVAGVSICTTTATEADETAAAGAQVPEAKQRGRDGLPVAVLLGHLQGLGRAAPVLETREPLVVGHLHGGAGSDSGERGSSV